MTDESKMQTGDDPADFTVDQVNAHLATAEDDERDRVLAAERDTDAGGKARKGVLDWYDGTAEGEDADGVYDEYVERQDTTSAFIIPSHNTVPQAVQDEDATARNQELEDAGVNQPQGFIGSDGASNLLG